MKNLFKKIGALLVAAVMVLSMCTAVFAATKDTATKDTVTKSATGGNGAVQTGNPMTAVSVALVMLVASGAMFVCYRRKIEK